MKKWLSLAAGLALLGCVLPGCAGRRFDRLMRDWEGHRLAELVVTWGQPRYTFSDGQGGQVVVYTPDDVPARSGRAGAAAPDAGLQSFRDGAATSQPVYNPSMAARWPIFRLFFVDSAGRIVRSSWRGRWAVP
jgi:hypothetical protein